MSIGLSSTAKDTRITIQAIDVSRSPTTITTEWTSAAFLEKIAAVRQLNEYGFASMGTPD
jgi:hypothetical protein